MSFKSSGGTPGRRIITADAFRAARLALAALLGLLFCSSFEGEIASVVAGRVALCEPLEAVERPYERKERAALAGLYAADLRELPTEAASASACSRAAGVSAPLPAARSVCSSSINSVLKTDTVLHQHIFGSAPSLLKYIVRSKRSIAAVTSDRSCDK